MVDDADNEINYIKTNHLNLEWTWTIMVKQEEKDSQPLVIDFLHYSEDKIRANKLDGMVEEQEEEEKEERLGMPDDQVDSDLGIMPITNNAPPSHFHSRTVEREDQNFDIQNAAALDQVDADLNKITLIKHEGANDPDMRRQKKYQTDNVDVDWYVTVLVTVVAVRAVDPLSELSHCQSCCQSCHQSSAAVSAIVRAVVRAQPAVRGAVRMFNEANFYLQVSGANG